MAAPKYTLVYFDIFGLAEPIRWMFEYARVPFKDHRIPELPYYVSDGPKPEWEALKTKTPFGTVPILEVDGKYLGETMSIVRYLAPHLKLAGKDDWETAQADSLITYLSSDFMVPFMQVMREMDQDKKKADKEKFAERIPKVAETFEKILQKTGSGFLVGQALTYADFCVASFYDLIEALIGPGLLTKYSLLSKHHQQVRGLPGVKEFIQKHAHLKF